MTVFAPVDGDTGERDRLCRFHRHRDLAQIIRRNHNKLAPAWSFEAVTTPGQGSTHLTIDHFLARDRKTEHWPRSPHVHFDEWQDRYYSETNGQNAPRSCGAITGTGTCSMLIPADPGWGSHLPLKRLLKSQSSVLRPRRRMPCRCWQRSPAPPARRQRHAVSACGRPRNSVRASWR